jgi:hypothetical protein
VFLFIAAAIAVAMKLEAKKTVAPAPAE